MAPLKPVTLRQRALFTALKDSGTRVHTAAFVLQWRPVEAPEVGIGYTASTKAVGNAVKRNRARRRLKAAVALALKDALMPAAGRHVALVARAEVLTIGFEPLLADVRRALRQAGVV